MEHLPHQASLPATHVTLTDISPFAVQSARKWEALFQTRLDAAYAWIAREVGLEGRADFHPSTLRRRPDAAVYYAVLSIFPFLCKLLPCSANFPSEKPDTAD